MKRKVEPEWLDQMAGDEPGAQLNRADLRHLNRVAGTWEWFAEALAGLPERPGCWLEVGAGEGDLAKALWSEGWEVDGLDVQGEPEDWPGSRVWLREAVEGFMGWGAYDGICANLFLHQLEDEGLREVGRRVREAGVSAVVAQEPWRSRWAQGIFLVSSVLLGMGEVSRHDGWVSVRGGFQGDELPELLGLARTEWRWTVRHSALGLYRMVAWREK